MLMFVGLIRWSIRNVCYLFGRICRWR